MPSRPREPMAQGFVPSVSAAWIRTSAGCPTTSIAFAVVPTPQSSAKVLVVDLPAIIWEVARRIHSGAACIGFQEHG
jgi:hypothetical protein